MRNVHTWKQVTPEGEKREIRASKFGKEWKLQSKLRHEEIWTYHDVPLLEDLEELYDILFRKYQRKRLAYDDVVAVQKMVEEAKKNHPHPEPADDESDGETEEEW